ncbi:ABC transporter permease [Telmatobacter bradus]|uniref:ABC transporter permease n=1 Tax=Telmatobacter bradus TaxID=474953 RepID=UPI003B428D26
MNKLVFANLLHRPLRSVISIFAVAIEVVMMLSIIAILMGQLTGQKRMNNGIGADLMVRPGNATFLNGVSGAPISVKLTEVLAKVPHVTVASPVFTNLSMTDQLEVLWGIDYASYSKLSPFVYLEGGPPQGPYDLIVDDVYALTGGGHHVGETVSVMKHPFRISGIFEHGKGGRKLIPITTMGELTGSDGKASAFYLKLDNEENADLVTREIHAVPGLEGYQIMTMKEWYSLLTPDHIPALNTAMHVVIGIAVVIGFLVIFQSMYTAVLERTREIGILKAMGASKLKIVDVIVRETALLSLVGVATGIGFSLLLKVFLSHRFPGLYLDMNLHWILQGAGIAFVGSVLGSFYPALMAARKDPIDALAYE